MLDWKVVEQFRRGLRGALIGPSDPDYEKSRRVYNGMIDRRPALIALCEDTADVSAAIRLARGHGVRIAIRGGGHNAGGLGVCDDGLVVDLSRLSGVHVDPEARTARVEGGCRWGQVDAATHPFGFAVPSGFIANTGVGGLTLGGGTGHLTRQYGLTIDNLLSCEVVLADGRLVRASEAEHEDLFWALRGGGGNFGAVTAFEFRLQPVDVVVAGPTLWPIERGREILQWYREFIVSAPEELGGFFAFMTVPPVPSFPPEWHGKKMCGVVWCWNGPAGRVDEVLAQARALKPAIDGVMPVPFPALQSVFDPLYPPGLQWYWRAAFFETIPDQAVEQHVRFAEQLPTMFSTMHLYPMDGAAHRVGRSETAFSYREANWNGVIVGVDPDPANREKITRWTREYSDALQPYSLGGAYVNFLMGDEGSGRIRAAYRDNFARLVEIKRRYDPENLFRVNQNIDPAAVTAEAEPIAPV